MDLRKMMQVYRDDGLAVDLASARVCQDIVLITQLRDYLRTILNG